MQINDTVSHGAPGRLARLGGAHGDAVRTDHDHHWEARFEPGAMLVHGMGLALQPDVREREPRLRVA